MQAVLDFINNHVRDIFIPLTALALLRVGMCLAQLKRMAHLREKKGSYHAVRGHCEELGVWFGALAGLLLPVIVPGHSRRCHRPAHRREEGPGPG